MKIRTSRFAPKTLAMAMAIGFAASSPVVAQESQELEVLRRTTQELIDTLVDAGVLTRDKADALVKAAQAKAKAEARVASAAGNGEGGKKTVRVFHVPESVKNDLRAEIKQEVLAQAKAERWAQPEALPEWLDRFTFEGDLRLRYQNDNLPSGNTAAGPDYFGDVNSLATRAADMVGVNANTQANRDRYRLQARLGVQAKVTDSVQAGIRLATGNTNDRVSTNQTLGQNFNKYQLMLDRAYLTYKPIESITLTGGRIANPFFGTDLVWDPDLNFEGFAATYRQRFGSTEPYLTVGYFPLRENNPPSARDRALLAVQGGSAFEFGNRNKLTLGAAWYKYNNLAGRLESDAAYLNAESGYGSRYAYPSGLRQKGNTLFATSAYADTACSTTTPDGCHYGLASRFTELNLTAALDIAVFDPIHVILTGDYVRNLAFDRKEMAGRTGLTLKDGKDYGYQLRAQVGYPKITKRHEWNAYMAYRYLGSDAVLDAFTDSDFGLGGTNSKGYILGFNYGLERNFWLGARWMSSDPVESFAPRTGATTPVTAKYSVDTLMVDLNAKF